MSLDLRDIERSVGADLFRRPFLTYSINAAILRLYIANVLTSDDDDDDFEVPAYIFDDPPFSPEEARPSVNRSNSTTNSEETAHSFRSETILQHILAVLVFIVTFLIRAIGFFETIMWFLLAIIFKALHLPRVYGFEKLLLDARVILLPRLRYVHKSVRFDVTNDGYPLTPFVAERRGLGPFSLTFVSASGDLTRETSATLRLLRYATHFPISYWAEDSVALVGRHENFIKSIMAQSERGEDSDVHLNLGWHIDIIESTKFKISVEFRRSKSHPANMTDGTQIRSATRSVIQAEVCLPPTTESLELVLKSMEQFATVCEAAERGRRPFNGKRFSICGIGLGISISLVLFYEGVQGLFKPSEDVLTLAVGAYTLWMTLGRSAALGEIEEKTALMVKSRENILLSYHGLADIRENVINTSWIPEISRQEPSDEVVTEGDDVQDGSISLDEAAVCLSIFDHFGHMVKWKGPKLKLTRLRIVTSSDENDIAVGHILALDRIPSLQALPFKPRDKPLQRLG